MVFRVSQLRNLIGVILVLICGIFGFVLVWDLRSETLITVCGFRRYSCAITKLFSLNLL
ncbi:hypothetical protein Hanom_Chr16g01497231 [Helianthus anomalus]